MSWDHARFVDYVAKHAPASTRSGLLQANSRKYSDDYPRVFLTYYSMPDWLDIFSSAPSYDRGLARPKVEFQKRLDTTPFAQMIGEYRHAAQKHQDNVAKVLDQINSLPSGQALLKEVGGVKKATGAKQAPPRYWVRVMPYWHYFKTMPDHDYFNSTPSALRPGENLSTISDGTRPNYKDEYEKNAPVRGDDHQPVSGEIGTGTGANVALFYSPETWASDRATKNPGFQADEVLFHELTHVTRMLRVRVTNVEVQGGGGYGNIEEYFATVITNVYMSDKGLTDLRGLYSNELIRETTRTVKLKDDDVAIVTTDPLPSGWSVMKDPKNFYSNVDKLNIPPRQLMKVFSETQQDFYFALAHLPDLKPAFNPPRQHFKENLRPNI